MASSLDPSTWDLETAGGIPYKLVSRSGGEDREKASATEKLIIQSQHLDNFMAESFPTPIVLAGFVVIDPSRRMPAAPWMITKTVTWDALDKSRPVDPYGAHQSAEDNTYGTLIELSVTYETGENNEDEENDPDENKPETFLEHSLSAGVEYLSIPPTKIEESEGEDPEANQGVYTANKDQQLGAFKLIPTVEHQLKWKWALKPNWNTIYETLGKVNDDAIKLFNNAKKHHVLFTGVSGQQNFKLFRARRGQTGIIIDPWSLDFKFSQRTINDGDSQYGWNHVFSPKKGKWVKIKREDTGRFLYEDADFKLLFKADTNNNPSDD